MRGALLEIAGVALYLALMLALILGGADLAWVIALSGSMTLFSGMLSALAARRWDVAARFIASGVTRERSMLIVPTAGWLLVVELSNLAMYAFSRVILGAYRSPTAVGFFEGPVRAHNLLYALGGALAVPVVPTASRYAASGDERRLRELVLRGSRYTLALFVPLCVTLICLAEPILEVWLGDRYGAGASALAILVSYWLLYGALVVTPGFLVGAGRARQAGIVMACTAALNLVLTLILTPELGLEGPALGTAIPFALAFPVLLRVGLRASGATLAELARAAWLPAYGLALVLAGALLGLRALLDPDSLPVVVALAGGGVLAYWIAFYGIALSADERARPPAPWLRGRRSPGRRVAMRHQLAAPQAELREARRPAVARARRELDLRGPLDSDVRVVEAKAGLGLRVVVGRALVDHVRALRDDAEAVREAVRDVELAVALRIELVALPLAEGGRVRADVHEHVEDAPARAAHELRHPGLEVHAAQHAARGARVVVLYPVLADAELLEHARAKGLEEEPARVPVDRGLEQKRPLEACLDQLHAGARLSTRSAISPASASDDVAAGEGALRTCRARSVSASTKSSTRVPSRPSACARSPAKPSSKSPAPSSGT